MSMSGVCSEATLRYGRHYDQVPSPADLASLTSQSNFTSRPRVIYPFACLGGRGSPILLAVDDARLTELGAKTKSNSARTATMAPIP
jgi:hypothetical protein